MAHRRLAVFLATAAALGSAIVPAASTAATAAGGCGPEWTQVRVPTPGEQSDLWDVAAFAPNDAWAVGSTDPSEGERHPLVIHWDGISWNQVPTPQDGEQLTLMGVSGAAADDIWAVSGRAMHWDGTAWTEVPIDLKHGGVAEDVVAFASDDVWASGYFGVSHWDGHRWRMVERDGGRTVLNAIDGSSPSDVWTVGYRFSDFPSPDGTFSKHWDGERFRSVPTPSSEYAHLHDVTALSPTDAWAVGFILRDDTNVDPLAAHWDGTHWKVTATVFTANGESFDGVHAIASDDVWAVGDDIQHWNGLSWTVVEDPGATLHRVTSDPTGAHQWAVGHSGVVGSTRAAVFERCP